MLVFPHLSPSPVLCWQLSQLKTLRLQPATTFLWCTAPLWTTAGTSFTYTLFTLLKPWTTKITYLLLCFRLKQKNHSHFALISLALQPRSVRDVAWQQTFNDTVRGDGMHRNGSQESRRQRQQQQLMETWGECEMNPLPHPPPHQPSSVYTNTVRTQRMVSVCRKTTNPEAKLYHLMLRRKTTKQHASNTHTQHRFNL